MLKTVRILTTLPTPSAEKRPPVKPSSAGPSAQERTYLAYAHSVIRDLLGRESSPIERQSWADQFVRGTKPETLPLCLMYSAEYRHTRVRSLFEKTFKRPPTWEELQQWAGRVTLGGNLESPCFESLWADMLTSDEYLHRNGQSNETFVRALFRDVLDRRPEAHEAESWRGLLDAFVANKNSLTKQFLQSREYRTQQIQQWTESFLVRGTFPTEYATFLVKMEQGHSPEKLKAEMLCSEEYFTRRLRRQTP